MSSYPITILLTSILFCTGTTVLTCMLKRSNRRKDKLLTDMQATLDSLHLGLADNGDRQETDYTKNIFDDNMRTAELTTRLQQSRLTVQQCGYSPATPERYRYIQSMVIKGMNAQEIADTLSMSLHETTQIISLIKVAHPQQDGNKKTLPLQEPADNENPPPATREQQIRQSAHKQPPALRTAGTVNKSIKLARWLKLRAVVPWSLRKQSSREPPARPSPQPERLSCRPLPGYT
ncbi:MAG: hypothetical protein KJ990_13090 [Proteobacteria bacterium]|nr:hypothetical protein [Pseudomonadota bacterium]MBU1649788.1 hypothetical protein [Pseudomonadota bacterium]